MRMMEAVDDSGGQLLAFMGRMMFMANDNTAVGHRMFGEAPATVLVAVVAAQEAAQ